MPTRVTRFETIVVPADRLANCISGIQAIEMQARDFPANAAEVAIGERLSEPSQDQASCFLQRWRRKIQPDLIAFETGGVGANVVTSENALPVVQPKFPVMPIASEDAVRVHAAHRERITLVGASVVDRINVAACVQ